jgi:hypothetical protein
MYEMSLGRVLDEKNLPAEDISDERKPEASEGTDRDVKVDADAAG